MAERRPMLDLARLREAREECHRAVQWLARAAYAYIPAKPDHSHANLGWDADLNRFTTHPLKADLHFGLAVPDLSLTILPDPESEPAAMLRLDGRPDAEARSWLGEQMRARGLDPGKLDAPLPFELAPHPIASGASYRAGQFAAELEKLALWFGNGDGLLRHMRAHLERQFSISPVRTWPHHFDMAILISLDPEGGENARSVGVGFTPGDEHYQEPYFYVTPWPYPEAAKLGALPALGHWHREGFTAAIATATRIMAAQDPGGEADEFLHEAIAISLRALGAASPTVAH